MRLGIRLQLLLALGALLAVAFVPLYFAVARIAEASLAGARRDAARDLGRAVAGHVLEATRGGSDANAGVLLEAQLSEGSVLAVGVYRDGVRAHGVGQLSLLPIEPPAGEATNRIKLPSGDGLRVMVPRADASCVVVLSLEADPAARDPLVGLVGLYTGAFALALLVFAYLAMTRLVVKPLDGISNAARRVAGGARQFDLAPSGAREMLELTGNLGAMTASLRRDEESLRAKIEELEQTTKELASAHETVIRSERLASVGRLAAGMAHEIGNPLSALIGLQELLLSDEISEDQREVLSRMKRETERIHLVLRDLLDFARTRDPQSEGAGECEVLEVAETVRSLLAPQRSMYAVTLHVEVPPGLPEVGIGDGRLQQVLLNLVMNAADAIGEKEGNVWLRATESDGNVLVFVDDDGPGIEAAISDRLFEPFVTTKEVGKGTGLGLAVCRGLLEAAGGTITTEDSPEGGARFVLTLPSAPR